MIPATSAAPFSSWVRIYDGRFLHWWDPRSWWREDLEHAAFPWWWSDDQWRRKQHPGEYP